jgi:orotate phosphoribosyltransferase
MSTYPRLYEAIGNMLGTESVRPKSLAQLRRAVVALVCERGYERREKPFRLASGELSHDYVDGKYILDNGARLYLVATVALAAANALEARFDAVGGRTMGTDPLAHAIAMITDCKWFSVRKEPKRHGRQEWIEGSRLNPGTRVLLVDDIVSTGASIMAAHDHVIRTGASVVGIVALVDRGEFARQLFATMQIPYTALVTYRDLCIAQVGG